MSYIFNMNEMNVEGKPENKEDINIIDNGYRNCDIAKELQPPMDIEDALKIAGFGTYQILLVLTCGLILYSVNTESYSISYIVPAAECDLELSVKEKSLLTSVGFLGIISTQFFWGFISDTRGRKNCLLYTLLSSSVFTFAAAFSPTLWQILLFRFLNGAMLSSASATVFTYVGEFCGKQHCSAAIMTSCIFIGLAITALPGLAWLILPLSLEIQILTLKFTSWRLYMLMSGIPSLITCFALFFFSESPKFLLFEGKRDDAVDVLAKIYKVNKRTKNDFPVKMLRCDVKKAGKGNIFKDFFAQLLPLFGLKHLKNTFLACTLQFGIFSVSSGLFLWYPDILTQLSKGEGGLSVCAAISEVFSQPDEEGGSCEGKLPTSVFMQNLWIGLVYLLGYSLISFIINLAGIKTILFSFVGLAGLCGSALLWISQPTVINLLFVGMLVLSGLCVGVVNAAVVEMFPTRLRAMSACVSMFCGRMGSVVASSFVGYLLHWNCEVTFAIFSAILIGYGQFNIIILLASGGSLMVVIIETMAMMFITPSSQCDLELTLPLKGLLSAISFLGVVSSSHLWGFIADTKGRKNVLVISMVASFITSITSSIIPQAWLFILIRFVNGFFVGGASAVVYAYAGEFHDHVYRPKVISWIATFVAFGNMVIPGLAWIVLPLDFNYYVPGLEIAFRPWRLLIILYGTPSLFFAIWLYCLPESPKYLLAMGRQEESLEILKYIFAKNSGKDPEEFPVSELIFDEVILDDDKKAGLLKSMWQQTVPLFKTPYVLKTFMVCILQFTAFACSSGFLMWYPEVLTRMATYGKAFPEEPVSMCKAINYHNEQKGLNITQMVLIEKCNDTVDVDVFLVSLLIGTSFAILYILIGIVINIIGAKRLVIGFLVVTTSAGIGAQLISGMLPSQTLMGIFLTSATTIGILNTIVVELFPTSLRAMALAISLMAGRFGAVAGSNASGPLVYEFCDYTFYIYACDHLILLLTLLLLPSPPSIKKMIELNV